MGAASHSTLMKVQAETMAAADVVADATQDAVVAAMVAAEEAAVVLITGEIQNRQMMRNRCMSTWRTAQQTRR